MPASGQDCRGLIRRAQETQDDVGGADEKQSRQANRYWCGSFDFHDAHTEARHRMTDLAAFPADLPKTRGTEIMCVHGHDRSAFRATVTFEWPDAELLFKGNG